MIIGLDASRANRGRKTGTEWYAFYLIKSLAAIDRKNHYRLYLDAPLSPELAEAIKNNPNFSARVLAWPFLAFWTLGRLTLEMIFRRPDVLFIPAHTLPLIFPRKTVNTIHDIAFVREQNLYRTKEMKERIKGSRRLSNWLIRLISLGKYGANSLDYLYWSTAFALKHARKIITVSHFTRQEILDFYPRTKPEKIAVVHNGYPDDLYRVLDKPEKIRAVQEKYELKAPYFLYVGRLEKKKNTANLIEAFAILRENYPDIKDKLVLIGDASYGYDEVKYTIEEFNLASEVKMTGWAEEADLPYIFNGADAFIFPSRHEGFGLPVIQALACGLPTAVSDLPVFREIAADAVLYFDQNDKRSIASVMAEIATNRNRRVELKAKGLKKASEFSWEKCARETLKELENW